MSKRVIVPLANGFEEIEALSIIDVLRRASIEVITTAIEKKNVKGAHGVTVIADEHIDDINPDMFDVIVLPGGLPGAEHLSNDSRILKIIKDFHERQKLIGAICAAPMALGKAGVIEGEFTCYPSFEKNVADSGYTDTKSVVRYENVVTSRGPGTAICFALELVKDLAGDEKYSDLKKGLLAEYC